MVKGFSEELYETLLEGLLKPTPKWLRMAEMYKRFVPDNCSCTFTDEDAEALFEYESTGKGEFHHGIFGNPPFNGYWVGKHWMDITIGMWKEDIGKTLFYSELEKDYPEWFLSKVFKQ